MTKEYEPEATAAGIDASRRVAWARYYAETEKVAMLMRHNATLLRLLARLATKVLRSEALLVLEPDGELRREARAIIASLRARSRGRVAVEEAERAA